MAQSSLVVNSISWVHSQDQFQRFLPTNNTTNDPPESPLPKSPLPSHLSFSPTHRPTRKIQRRRVTVLSAELLHLVLLAIFLQEIRRPVLADDAHVRTTARTQVVEDSRVDRVRRQLQRLCFLHRIAHRDPTSISGL